MASSERERQRQLSSSTQSIRPIARSLPDGLCFGNYQLVRLIAVGGMSEVYEAIHSGLDKRVAVKVLRPDLAENLEARERFLSEGVNAARIRHTNVVDVTDVGIVNELPYLVMSMLDGEDLGAIYERHGRLPVSDLIDVLLPVTAAVAIGHAQGIVHRDLKPDNIFLHQEGCRLIPKVLDFGVSRAMYGRRITVNTTIFGTPQYMSPEQARGAAIDARTDQYSLGVILYEGVTGHLPRDSTNALELLHSIAFDNFQRPSEHVELPQELETVILRAMSHEPNDRFSSMRELALDLLPFASPSAREYWALELQSMSETDAADVPLLAFARHPTHPPQSPLLLAPTEGPSSASELTFETLAPPDWTAPAGTPSRDSLQPQIAAITRRVPQPQRKVFWISAIAGALLGLGGAWLGGHAHGSRAEKMPAPVPSSPRQFEVAVQVVPPTATVLLDGWPVAIGTYRGRFPLDGKLHELRASAEGFITRSVNFRDEAPPRLIRLNPSASVLAPHATPAPEPSAAGGPLPAPNDVGSPERARSTIIRRRTTEPKAVRPPSSLLGPTMLLESAAPKVRIIDEHRPRVRIIE